MLTSSFPRFKEDPAGVFVHRLSSSLAKKGVGIVVLAPHDDSYRKSETWDGIHIRRFPYFFPSNLQKLCYRAGILKNTKGKSGAYFQVPFFLIMEAISSLRVLRSYKVDLIHAHWSLPQGLVGLLCGKMLRLPCVTTIHGSDIYAFENPLLRLLNSMVINKSQVCTVNSTATSRKALALSGRKDVTIIPMGFDPTLFEGVRQKALRERGDEKTVLYVGRLIDWKGVDNLIGALPAVKKRLPKTKLTLIGDGPQKARLLALAASLGLTDSVSFLGSIPQQELASYYAKADVFVLPSIVNTRGETEGLGLVLLEAMACQTPVVGTNVGGIPDIIKDGYTGLLARPEDPGDLAEKIVKLLSDEDLTRDLTARAYRYVMSHFTWDHIAEEFLEIYHKALTR